MIRCGRPNFVALALILSMLLAPAAALAQGVLLPFSPVFGSTVTIAANATPSSVSGTLGLKGNASRLRVCNTGTVFGFFRMSTASTATASNGDAVILPGQCLVVDAQPAYASAAVLSSTTTAINVTFTWGAGGF
jgi:hypothetical protein